MGLGFKSEIAMKDHDYVEAKWEIEIKPVWMPANEVTFVMPLCHAGLTLSLH
jgi:hypothetical protein